MSQAALYCRISSHTSDTDDPWASLPRQEEKLRALAERDGAAVTTVYREVYTGTRTDRAEFQDLLARMAAGEVQVVYVVAFDRLTRNGALDEVESLRRTFVRLGCDVITPSEVWRFSDESAETPHGKVNFRLRGVLAGYERDLIEHRLREGREKKAKSGGDYGGPTPYGYVGTFDPASGAKRFEVDEHQAGVVRRIYREYLAGAGYKAIAAGLIADGIPSPRGGRWDTSAIRYVLHNAVYAGLTEFLKPYRRHRIKSKSPTVIAPSLVFPAIIDVDTMQAARERLAERRQDHRRGVVEQHPLSGILRCSGCEGGLVIGQSRKRVGTAMQHYYLCRSLKDTRMTCAAPERMPYDQANLVVLEALQFALPSLAPARRRRRPKREEPTAIADARRELARLEQEEVNFARLLAQGAMEMDTYQRATRPLRDDMARVRARLAAHDVEREEDEEHLRRRAALVALGEHLRLVDVDAPDLRGFFSRALTAVYLERACRDPKDGRRWLLRVKSMDLVTGDRIEGDAWAVRSSS